MIFQVLNNEEVVQLQVELNKELPGSAKMFYILCNLQCGLLHGFEVIVDRWPDWMCIIVRPQSPEAVACYFQHYYICHTRSVKAFNFFIQRPCVVDWSKPVCFTGVPYDALPVLQDQCRKHGGRLSSVENRFMYAWTKPTPPELPSVPEGLTLTILTPKDAPALCGRWQHYRPEPGLEEYMRDITVRFDSSALVDSNDKLVAYVGMQYNGAMAMLHVDPQHRGKGLGQLVLMDLTRKLLAKGLTAYGLIPTSDTSFITTSSQKLGFTWVPQGGMSWVRYHPRFAPGSVLSPLSPLPVAMVKSVRRGTSGSPLPYPSSYPPSTLSGRQDEAEDPGRGHLFLTALPLSCNECADMSCDPVNGCPRVRVGIS